MNLRKIHLRDLILSIITILIILNLGILNFGDFRKPIQWLTAIVAILLFAFSLSHKSVSKRITKYSHFTFVWISIFMAFLTIELFYALLSSNMSFRVVASKIYIYLWVLLYYPILYLMTFEDTKRKLFKRICLWTVVAMGLNTVVWYLYNYHHKVVMYYVLFQNGENYLRNGLQRIGTTSLTGWLFAASIYLFAVGKHKYDKIIAAVLIGFNLWYAQIVFQSRAQVLTLCFCIFFVAVFAKKKPLKTIILYCALFAALVAFEQSDYFAEFLNGMSVQTYSIGTRVEAINYYVDLLKNHYLLGINAISDLDTIRGTAGRFYFSDLGIASKLFEIGILGLIVFVIPIIRIGCQGVFKINKNDEQYPFAASLAVYTLVFSLLSNDIYSWARLFALPFILAYFDFKVGGRIRENT